MAFAQRVITVSPEEYLEQEMRSDIKHEYDNGLVVAMVGASRAHNLIAVSLLTAIKMHIKSGPCRVYISDMKVRINTRDRDQFFYPDVMVSCDPEPPSEYYEDQPTLVIEVLSPSTEMRDKLDKLSAYGQIPSLQEYLTVAQDRVEVNRYTWAEGKTFLTQYLDDDVVELESIGLKITVKDIYADVAGKVFNE